jgi:hypothetical protein
LISVSYAKRARLPIFGTINAPNKGETSKERRKKMEKTSKALKVALMAGMVSLIATPALARSISMKDAGIGLWIFVIIGAIIVLLQLIPAAILFFSFIGTTAAMALKKGKKAEEEVLLPAPEAVAVKE